MPRYIDADLLLEQLSKKKSEVAKGRYTEGFNDAIMRVRSMVSSSVTADVVPKSEVEALKEMLDATIAGQETLQKAFAKTKTEVAREIFEEIETCMKDFEDDDDGYLLKRCEFEFFMRELKKKHTEEQNNATY